MRKTWQTKEWKNAVKAFTSGKSCQWCGVTSGLTAHHPFLKSYSDGVYLNLYLSGCIVLCNRCHFSLHKGLVLCPICKSHYMRVGSDRCYSCFILSHPEILEARERKKEEIKRARREYAKKKREELKRKIKVDGSPKKNSR